MRSRGFAVALGVALLGTLLVLWKQSPSVVEDTDLTQDGIRTSTTADASRIAQKAADGDHKGITAPTADSLTPSEGQPDGQTKGSVLPPDHKTDIHAAPSEDQLDDQTEVSTVASENQPGDQTKMSDLLLDDQTEVSTVVSENQL